MRISEFQNLKIDVLESLENEDVSLAETKDQITKQAGGRKWKILKQRESDLHGSGGAQLMWAIRIPLKARRLGMGYKGLHITTGHAEHCN